VKITRFEDIEVWKSARKLANLVYQATEARNLSKDFELRDQMIRAALSAMANIAEGFDSGSDAEFARFLRISQRSATELQSHLYVAADRGYLAPSAYDSLYSKASDVKKLTGGFIRHLKGSRRSTKDYGLGTKDFQCARLSLR